MRESISDKSKQKQAKENQNWGYNSAKSLKSYVWLHWFSISVKANKCLRILNMDGRPQRRTGTSSLSILSVVPLVFQQCKNSKIFFYQCIKSKIFANGKYGPGAGHFKGLAPDVKAAPGFIVACAASELYYQEGFHPNFLLLLLMVTSPSQISD